MLKPRSHSFVLEIFFLIALVSTPNYVDCSCNKIFTSTGDTKVGRFEVSRRMSAKPYKVLINEQGDLMATANRTQEDFKPMHCLYKFIADENERVMVNFSSFRLRGDEPECAREYIDIFIKLRPEDNLETAIGQEPSNGRFCTAVMPRKLVSLHNMIVIIIYSELRPQTTRELMFSGSFEFIKSKSFQQIGPPAPNTLCTHTIYHSSDKKEGEFHSVTYPGVYVKGLKCSYKFIGEAKQRVRLEFLDLDLYSGGSHCPLDSIKVFDGLEETDPIISTICGSHRSLIIFSTRENLLITFTTLQRQAEVQNRGFSAYFEFSDRFVDTSFIIGQNAKYIRGSECDQRIISYKATKGYIISPDSKHHNNAICRYIFEGLQTSLDSEKVLLKFTEFDLKNPHQIDAHSTSTTTTTTTTTSTTQSPLTIASDLLLFNQTATFGQDSNSPTGSNTTSEQCNDNYVRLYTGEQKPDQKQDPNDYDYVFCGAETPQSLESDAASLLMEYNSGSIGGYFRADYSFIIDYRIPGIQISSGCDYIYRSDYLKTGTFNSPRHPSWYINDINCSYTFLTKNEEVLLLQFGSFKMAGTFSDKILGYNEACRGEDSVEIFELSLDNNETRILDRTEIGAYCGTTTPGPMLSYRPVRIYFRTNAEKVHYGFSAIYNFYPINALKTNEFVTNCGAQIYATQRLRSGIIVSPETYRPETYEKRNHICSWNITARSSYKIALDFSRFELEGSPAARGCVTASVRLTISKHKNPIEICGTMSPSNGSSHQFISDNEWLSVTFVSTKQASGSNGFAATWTEIKRPS